LGRPHVQTRLLHQPSPPEKEEESRVTTELKTQEWFQEGDKIIDEIFKFVEKALRALPEDVLKLESIGLQHSTNRH
jgi:hypothetical protein